MIRAGHLNLSHVVPGTWDRWLTGVKAVDRGEGCRQLSVIVDVVTGVMFSIFGFNILMRKLFLYIIAFNLL